MAKIPLARPGRSPLQDAAYVRKSLRSLAKRLHARGINIRTYVSMLLAEAVEATLSLEPKDRVVRRRTESTRCANRVLMHRSKQPPYSIRPSARASENDRDRGGRILAGFRRSSSVHDDDIDVRAHKLRRNTCPFRKFHPAWIRIVRQNHRMIGADACNPILTRNVRRRLVQVAAPA